MAPQPDEEAVQLLLSPAEELGIETWCKAFSFVLSGLCTWNTLRAVSRTFCDISATPGVWEGACVCIEAEDLEMHNGMYRFLSLTSQLHMANRLVANFKGAQCRAKRHAASACLEQLAVRCPAATSLCIRDWLMFENLGIQRLHTCSGAGRCFRGLRHLEIAGCDNISSYDVLLPLFERHPDLLSLRASFAPKATAGVAFARALPKKLMVFGFVSFEGPEALTEALKRCPLEHLWFAATAKWNSRLSAVIAEYGQDLRTLCLPSLLKEESCMDVVRSCERLELLCRMRIGIPPFGSGVLADDFEVLPSGYGTVLRRRGSSAELVHNALWAPPHARAKEQEREERRPSTVTSEPCSEFQPAPRGGAASAEAAAPRPAPVRANAIWAGRRAVGELPRRGQQSHPNPSTDLIRRAAEEWHVRRGL